MNTRKAYYLNGIEVQKPNILKFGNVTRYGCFSDQEIISAGYEIREIIDPIPEPYLPSIEELVEGALRYGEDGGSPTYSINKEFEVQRRRDSHPQEFAEYNTRVEACIAWANSQPHRED